jgi:subtilase family serine protease
MTHAPRRKSRTRRWLISDVDHLERRELLTVAALSHFTLIPAHVEVSSKAVHVKSPGHTTADIAAAATKHAPAGHASKTSVKSSHKAAPKLTAAKLPPLLSSTLVVRKAQGAGGPVPGAFAPLQIQTAYTATTLGVTNQGQGQTIGIVDEFNDPNIIGDANTFSARYSLPQFNGPGAPTLTVAKDTTFAPVPNSPLGFFDTSIETSLDVEWAHAMAPKANILLVEVPATGSTQNQFAELLDGVKYAASHGASVVSLSYGFPETNVSPPNQPFINLPALYSQDQAYLATGPASNVAVTISSGDYTLALFPATSPNAIAVGGTSLHLSASGQYSYETAWGGSATSGAGGGGTSAFYSTPTFQGSNGVSFAGKRATPDVSLVADPLTGVSVYDSYGTNASSPWNDIGGTSLAAPLFAGMLSLAQQDRATLNKAPLTSVQIDTALYSLYNSSAYTNYFHDITLGNNTDFFGGTTGFNATTGYDRATGLGSPIARTLVPYLASL